ncbi:hypothetical protein [Nostoc sp. MG11]|uniref:hypothetical protein n=1 Tax=Nostoc sp. MG11 TaxID=2721166 RepID=UPI00186776F9|nr:hypothetical protein [Nostoc sp. MG11]
MKQSFDGTSDDFYRNLQDFVAADIIEVAALFLEAELGNPSTPPDQMIVWRNQNFQITKVVHLTQSDVDARVEMKWHKSH